MKNAKAKALHAKMGKKGYSSSGMNLKTGKYHPLAMKHMLSKSNKGFSETKEGRMFKK